MARDNKADKGKELVRDGHTITRNNTTLLLTWMGISAATAVAAGAANRRGMAFITKNGDLPVSTLIQAAGTAATIGAIAKTASANDKIRGYYYH